VSTDRALRCYIYIYIYIYISDIVIYFKFHENRCRRFGAVGDRKLHSPVDLAVGLYNSVYYRTSPLLVLRDPCIMATENHPPCRDFGRVVRPDAWIECSVCLHPQSEEYNTTTADNDSVGNGVDGFGRLARASVRGMRRNGSKDRSTRTS